MSHKSPFFPALVPKNPTAQTFEPEGYHSNHHQRISMDYSIGFFRQIMRSLCAQNFSDNISFPKEVRCFGQF
jgi:hypothetical protein